MRKGSALLVVFVLMLGVLAGCNKDDGDGPKGQGGQLDSASIAESQAAVSGDAASSAKPAQVDSNTGTDAGVQDASELPTGEGEAPSDQTETGPDGNKEPLPQIDLAVGDFAVYVEDDVAVKPEEYLSGVFVFSSDAGQFSLDEGEIVTRRGVGLNSAAGDIAEAYGGVSCSVVDDSSSIDDLDPWAMINGTNDDLAATLARGSFGDSYQVVYMALVLKDKIVTLDELTTNDYADGVKTYRLHFYVVDGVVNNIELLCI